MKRIAIHVVDGLIVVCLALAIFLFSRPSSPIRIAWSRFETQRRQVQAAARLWPALVAQSTPLAGETSEVQIIEIADYGCPFCRKAQPAIDSAVAQGLRLAFLNYPLPEHPHADGAALAAICAAKAGAFLRMHDDLIRSNTWQVDADWNREATAVGIDTSTFAMCVRDPNSRRALDAARGWADSMFVQGTPTFVSHSNVLTGVLTVRQLVELGRD
jgi:protein-disulfide isomerase